MLYNKLYQWFNMLSGEFGERGQTLKLRKLVLYGRREGIGKVGDYCLHSI